MSKRTVTGGGRSRRSVDGNDPLRRVAVRHVSVQSRERFVRRPRPDPRVPRRHLYGTPPATAAPSPTACSPRARGPRRSLRPASRRRVEDGRHPPDPPGTQGRKKDRDQPRHARSPVLGNRFGPADWSGLDGQGELLSAHFGHTYRPRKTYLLDKPVVAQTGSSTRLQPSPEINSAGGRGPSRPTAADTETPDGTVFSYPTRTTTKTRDPCRRTGR